MIGILVDCRSLVNVIHKEVEIKTRRAEAARESELPELAPHWTPEDEAANLARLSSSSSSIGDEFSQVGPLAAPSNGLISRPSSVHSSPSKQSQQSQNRTNQQATTTAAAAAKLIQDLSQIIPGPTALQHSQSASRLNKPAQSTSVSFAEPQTSIHSSNFSTAPLKSTASIPLDPSVLAQDLLASLSAFSSSSSSALDSDKRVEYHLNANAALTGGLLNTLSVANVHPPPLLPLIGDDGALNMNALVTNGVQQHEHDGMSSQQQQPQQKNGFANPRAQKRLQLGTRLLTRKLQHIGMHI